MQMAEPIEAAEIDFVEEIRLRRWARENYCYAEARMASWHPVIHDEMRRRDADESTLDETSVLADEEESPSPTDSTILTDLTDVAESTVVAPAAIGESMRPFGTIVPLRPDLPGLHGPHEITPPHTRIGAGVQESNVKSEMHYT